MSFRPLPPRAWLVVALLWLVACLNYLDRIMLTTMRGSVIDAIPMTDAKFGLLTSVFLWVYALFSPLTGFLADKFKRSHVIIASLLIWSVVTWLTSKATSFEYLLVTRALMGISEACYVPAALALIVDYHRGPTRSRATSVHMTGMMTGASLGGLGGWVAEHHSWNYAFSLFGLIGIGYAAVLMALLRDAPADREAPRQADNPGEARASFLDASRHLFGSRAFLYAFIYWGLLGVLWTIIGWMPTYLTEKFRLGQGVAGLSTTGYLQASALVGVLVGGYWADLWSRSTPRARIYVPVIGLGIAAPALLLVAGTDVLALALGGIILHGFFRAFTDANMMPVLCLITDPRYRATAYGFLNLCACLVGGISIYAGGALRDSGTPLNRLFQFAAISLVFCSWLLLRIKTDPAATERPAGSPSQT
jgi:MFS family permease